MSTAQPELGKYGVLYVDDEEQALKYFRKGLQSEYRVHTANGYAEALKLLEQEAGSIGVVLSDQRMAGKSGVELLSAIRERWPAIVRILITAYTEINSAVDAVNAGAIYKYINKPADLALLKQSLKEAMALHQETIHRDALAEMVRELEAQRRATQAAEAQREQLQQRLVAASREAGRAEVATGILHNVGNVLNSVITSAAVVNDTLGQSRVGNLCKGLALLEENADNLPAFLISDERGQRLAGYLIKLAGVLAEEHKTISTAMATLCRNIEHIAQVVRMQQSHGKEIILRQEVNPADLLDEAARVNEAETTQWGIHIDRDYACVPILLLDPHRVLQILINLINNAAKALKDRAAPGKRITLRIAQASGEGGERIRFQVVDNGDGIKPENLTRIFTYGFTTRSEGHGYGLHSSANAAREMGGLLGAASEGPGRGATFTLDLPMNTAEGAKTSPDNDLTGKAAA